MALKPFEFKEFTVHQDQCAMKIGTDGVLLGAWVSLNHQEDKILDIGAGTGLIALQLAQRSNANTIEAVEIDAAAFEQCTNNFDNSPWGDRLFCFHAPVQDFTMEMVDDPEESGYDLIISNPPFYTDDFKTNDAARDAARFTTSLPFQHLLVCAASLLNIDGRFATVIPYKEEADFIALAAEQELYVNRMCRVQGAPTADIKRTLIEFSFTKVDVENENLILEKARHVKTPTYDALVQPFYLDK